MDAAEIPTLKPRWDGGCITFHVEEVIARMKRENIEEADFLYNDTLVRVRKNSQTDDIVQDWCLKRAQEKPKNP